MIPITEDMAFGSLSSTNRMARRVLLSFLMKPLSVRLITREVNRDSREEAAVTRSAAVVDEAMRDEEEEAEADTLFEAETSSEEDVVSSSL